MIHLTKKFILKDIDEWVDLNAHCQFSFYDYIYHQMNMGKMNTDIYFALIELYWPTFITYKNYIFLDQHFSEKKFEELKNQNVNVEFWMNILCLDSYFENDDNGDEKASFLAKKLAEIWKAKLEKDFPNIKISVVYLEDKTVGDYGLTFYQESTNDQTATVPTGF